MNIIIFILADMNTNKFMPLPGGLHINILVRVFPIVLSNNMTEHNATLHYFSICLHVPGLHDCIANTCIKCLKHLNNSPSTHFSNKMLLNIIGNLLVWMLCRPYCGFSMPQFYLSNRDLAKHGNVVKHSFMLCIS